MNDWLVIFLVLVGGIGAAILFVGFLAALVTTAGINKYWGMASIFVPPLAIVFCLFNPSQTRYPLKLILLGLALVAAAAASFYYLIDGKFT